MHQYKKGSDSRQAKRQATKDQRRQQQVRRAQKRRAWPKVKAVTATSMPKAAPIAGPYLVRRFWEHLGLDKLLYQVGVQVKHKGLPITSWLFIALLFGVLNARSVSDLSAKAAHDPTVQAVLAVEDLERQRLYRVLNKVTGEQYLAYWDEIIAALQRDPRTATHRNGVVSGDDTTLFKSGTQMPYISLVYQASTKRFGSGYYLVSIHDADDAKHYPLGCDLHRPTRAQIQAAQDRRARKKLGIDLRKRDHLMRWLEQQIETHHAPELVLLTGLHLGAPLVTRVEALHRPGLGLAHPKRTDRLIRPKNKPVGEGKPKHWLTKTYAATDWHVLSDDGCRVVILGEADEGTLGFNKV